jgi:16S rRNA (adenine1518-N6/adenine1519-N6)-dimethyltransferase
MTPRSGQAELLRKYGLRLSKRMGQHFLVDTRVLARIVDQVQMLEVQRVVELGAGAGALSAELLDAGLTVEALELDARMVDLLRAEYTGEGLQVHRADIAKEDLDGHVGELPMAFVGNLPYQVTSSVLFGLLPAFQRTNCRGAVLMMQAEVAERLCASPGGGEYGVLSVLMGARCAMKRAFTVKPGCFLPPPKVHSAVVVLRPRTDPVELGESGRALVKRLFRERRKQVGGLLRRHYELDEIGLERMAIETGIEPRRRPEELALEDFQTLDRWLVGRGGDR